MDRDEEQARIARLLAEIEAAESSADALDPNDIARLAAGRPSDPLRAAIHARLEGEDAAVASVVAAVAAERGVSQRTQRPLWIPMAAAAVLVLALGGWFLSGPGAAARVGDDDLVRAFAALRTAEPTVFKGLHPLLAEERGAGAAPLPRGGLRVIRPQGAILALRPTLTWEAVNGADAYAVEVLSDEGEIVVSVSSPAASVAWPSEAPALEAGTEYVLRVASTVAGVRVEGSRAFRVPDATTQARYQQALSAIDKRTPPPLRAIARAHVALRLDLFAAAQRHLAKGLPDAAGPLASETLAYISRRQGVR